MLAGLSANPPGPAVDSQQLTSAILAGFGQPVNSYWFNLAGRGPQFPTSEPLSAGRRHRGAAGVHATRAAVARPPATRRPALSWRPTGTELARPRYQSAGAGPAGSWVLLGTLRPPMGFTMGQHF